VIGVAPVTVGNRVSVFQSNDAAFESMWQVIGRSRRSVVLETYTIEPDVIGMRTLQALIDARMRGVHVTLIYDDVGSQEIGWSPLMTTLVGLGADVVTFNPIDRAPWTVRHNPFMRNHRKIMVVDDTVAFCGSMNITAEYASAAMGGSGVFRDIHMRIRGPAVLDLLGVVRRVLQQPAAVRHESVSAAAVAATNAYLQHPRLLPFRPPGKAPMVRTGARVQILEENTILRKRHIQNAVRVAFRDAKESIFISTPYFIPPPRLRRALIRAAKAGVDVRILTTGSSDVLGTVWAGKYVMGRMLACGVKVYELDSGQYLHAKLVTVDGLFSNVGSFNLDYLSTHRNLEVVVAAFDQRLARDIETHFRSMTMSARLVSPDALSSRTVPERIVHFCAYQFARLWRKFNWFEQRE
jgi:cardiolipin synthase A/B